MKKVFRLLLCLLLFTGVLVQSWLNVQAQSKGGVSFEIRGEKVFTLPQIYTNDFTSLVFPILKREFMMPPLVFTNDTSSMLYHEISQRLGIRYRYYGADDRGYDCSGFVWRVYQEAGADFERVAARTLWRQLPEARGSETSRFGTLVFFNGVKHVGIVRDAYSFYHSSRSQGVTLSYFAGYWENRITGYRRAPISFYPEPIKIGD